MWELRVQSDPKNLQEIRQWLAHIGEAVGLAQDEISQMKVAVCEACANIIRHAYGGDHSRPIWLRARPKPNGVELEIRDFGRPFDPASVPVPDLERAHEGGYGVFLMHKLMDEVEYSSPTEGTGTMLRMIKSGQSSPSTA